MPNRPITRRITSAASSIASMALAVLAASASLIAQTTSHPDYASDRWPAEWIASPDAPMRDAGIFHFRKELTLASVPDSFLVHVSADNRFILLVNGARVGEGPASSDLGHWKYETFDLHPYLHSGANVIAATVWNFGTQAPVAQMFSRAGFLLQGDGPAESVANTNSSWRVEQERGHSISPVDFMALMHTYYAGPPGEVVDARKFDWSWASQKIDADHLVAWKPAALIGPGAGRPSQDTRTVWMLQPDPLPPMEFREISVGRTVSQSGTSRPVQQGTAISVAPHSTASILLDAGALTTAYPQLTVHGGSAAKLRLTYAEALVDARGEKGNRNDTAGRHILGLYDEFIADGQASRTFAPLIWRTWRYLQLDVSTADQPITIDNLSARFSAYTFEERARFSSTDDSDLAKIWEVGWRTARLCAHETYMDTPYYERLQYVGDTRIQALISYVVSGDDRLARQAIDAIDSSRIPDGITTSRYPSQLPQIIPTFSLMWIGMVHDFSVYRNDSPFVRSHLLGTRTVLDWFSHHQRPDGLINRLPWWPFVDWTADFKDGVPPQDADGGSAPITLQYIEALRDAADLETRLGEPARAQTYEQRANLAVQALLNLCWDSATGLLADTPAKSHFSQHANALAIWLDVIPKDQQQSVMRRVLGLGAPATPNEPSLSGASYYFRFYLARALEHAGMADYYVATLEPWRQMLRMGLTTWAETPEPTRSDSHAWSAHPNYDLLRLVAGIRPGAPGFSELVIEPHLGSLKNVTAAVPHPKGLIEVSFKVSSSGTEATLSVPEGLPAKLIWHGTAHDLHAGRQTLSLPQ